MKRLTYLMAAITIIIAIAFVICTLLWSIKTELPTSTIVYVTLSATTFSLFSIWIILDIIKDMFKD